MPKQIKFKAIASETKPESTWKHEDIDNIDFENGKIYVGKNFVFDLGKTRLFMYSGLSDSNVGDVYEEVEICPKTR